MRVSLKEWIVAQQGRHFCACGCGGVIRIIAEHHTRGVPRFINGHVTRVHNPMRGRRLDRNPNYTGGRFIDRQGYVVVLNPQRTNHRDRYTYEHRLVMEEYLGRRLADGEQVHHRNGQRSDNRIENLQLITASEHTRLHQDELRRSLGEAAYRRVKRRVARGLPYREVAPCSAS
jgi:hypothetical protein